MNASEPTASEPARPAAPWFGRRWEHRHAAGAALGSLLACGAYSAAARSWAPDAAPGTVEFWGTMTSLWSVWITQRRNVLALPVGIVSVVLMGWFFHGVGLRGQTWLHWAYYLPIQLWAWRQWTRGGPEGSELTVTALEPVGRLAVVALVVGLTALLGWLLDTAWEDARYAYWDASIVAASVMAMLLMSAKKVESWWLWIAPVNISAIGLYLRTGAFMFAALYVLFLIMAVVGLVRWTHAARRASP